MTKLSAADRVWNRACQLLGLPGPKSGDTELSAMLLAHSLAMNGGVLHSVEVLSKEEFDSALHGYRYFGLDSAADLFEKARLVPPEEAEEAEANLDAEYEPTDAAVLERFEAHFRSHPEAYAPVEN
ncbi:MAG: hypothetical protein M3Z28_02525 [Candidatus Dormibacteraeota bacterium]|nr:hypothetical protein [Candidatus Dormibacteraeota bacterium]